jgi:hypothetical protein
MVTGGAPLTWAAMRRWAEENDIGDDAVIIDQDGRLVRNLAADKDPFRGRPAIRLIARDRQNLSGPAKARSGTRPAGPATVQVTDGRL